MRQGRHRYRVGRAVGRAQAYLFTQELNEILEYGQKRLRRYCPVDTGRMRRSINVLHQDPVRNGVVRVSDAKNPRQSPHVAVAILAANVPYAVYVDTYEAALFLTARDMENRLRRLKKFKVKYRVSRREGSRTIREVVETRPFEPRKLIRITHDRISVDVQYPRVLHAFVTSKAIRRLS